MLHLLLFARLGLAAEPGAAPLEALLSEELARAQAALATRPEPPYYVALAVEERHDWALTTSEGAVYRRSDDLARTLDVDLRVGKPELDSTHELRGMSAWEDDDRPRISLPVEAGAEWGTRRLITDALDASYRSASERIVMIRANMAVKAEEESPAPDFSARPSVVDRRPVPELAVDLDAWQATLLAVSLRLDAHPDVHGSRAELQATHLQKTFVDTEGARLVHGRNYLRVAMSASTTAADGDSLDLYVAWDAHELGRLPDRAALEARADALVAELLALRAAPRGTPWSGPVMLSGRASGVFFHEVFGHRVEGHRQKSSSEGKTFAEHVGKQVLPTWMHVHDDPRVVERAGHQLNGHYAYDDEGSPAQVAPIIEGGVFSGFLMGRSPIEGFPTTNGHGRRQAGRAPVSRMGNTLVVADQGLPEAALRAKLVEAAKAQGLDYAYIVDDIEGGFTMTGRVMPNAFNIRASTTRRVYVDGRPDELVRGIDLVGTPFAAFGALIAAGDTPEVFNGFCGAESGYVPVSAVAPALVFEKLEFQLKEKGEERPPLLPKPVPPVDDRAAEVRP